jgi:hypothetical protein
MEHPAMNPFAAKLAAAHRRLAHHLHPSQVRRFGNFVLLLAMVAWSYEMLTFVPAPVHTDAMPLAVAPQPADSGREDPAPEPDPSANAIAAFDIAPS